MATILCVDDEATQLILLQFAFERAGFSVLTATDGQGAIEVVQTEQPDIILMDLMMPRKNGYETTAEIKALPGFANTPIILYTAYAQAELASKAKAVGATDIIRKTTPPKELVTLIRTLLETPHA